MNKRDFTRQEYFTFKYGSIKCKQTRKKGKTEMEQLASFLLVKTIVLVSILTKQKIKRILQTKYRKQKLTVRYWEKKVITHTKKEK